MIKYFSESNGQLDRKHKFTSIDKFVIKGDHQDIANQINSLYKEDISINEYKDIYAINNQFQEKRKKILEELKKKQEVEKGMNVMRI